MAEPLRIPIARLPTPVHRLDRLSAELDHELFVWRDDLTGCLESGNKIRKLEFLLAEARQSGATTIITCGAVQSNHVRATVYAARRLGLGVVVVVREPPEGLADDALWTGNALLDVLADAEMRRVPFDAYRAAGSAYDAFLEEAAATARDRGERPYVIPEGGTCPLGCWGYVRAVGEMMASWSALGLGPEGPDALYLPLGSGGTHAGVVLGAVRHRFDPTRVHAVNVCNDRAYFEDRVGRLVEQTAATYDLPGGATPLQIVDGHVGTGYARASDDDLRFYARVARLEGVLLDPCYTGKAFRGMLDELKRGRVPPGARVLFLHTGGAFSTFAYAEQYRRALA